MYENSTDREATFNATHLKLTNFIKFRVCVNILILLTHKPNF